MAAVGGFYTRWLRFVWFGRGLVWKPGNGLRVGPSFVSNPAGSPAMKTFCLALLLIALCQRAYAQDCKSSYFATKDAVVEFTEYDVND